jgi:hypothetical protein
MAGWASSLDVWGCYLVGSLAVSSGSLAEISGSLAVGFRLAVLAGCLVLLTGWVRLGVLAA